jgi:hypothetical protein
MRIYDMLAEETADDLFRKITALDAVINDAAATDGEKDNARRLKDRLQQRLKSDYPNERPQWAVAAERCCRIGVCLNPTSFE